MKARKNRVMKNTDPKSKTIRITLRLPRELYPALEAAAEYNGRSFNAEMVARLQATATEDQFSRVLRELADIKSLEREILETVTDRP